MAAKDANLYAVRGLAVLLLATLLGACGESPTGRRQLLLFPDDTLAGMGAQSFAQIKTQTTPSTDAAVNLYIECVTRRLTARQSGEWELAVLSDEKQLNAFALPGNKIGIYTGLLQAARSPDQLATVVGHEIGHVLARHGNERASSQFATEAGLSLLYQLWTGGNEAGVPTDVAFTLLGLGAEVGILLPFSRAHEAEADQIGLMLMAEAGFDPRQSVELWQNMAAAGDDGLGIEFLSTHPSHESRARLLKGNMGKALKRYESVRLETPAPDCVLARAPPAPAIRPQSAASGGWRW